MKKYSKKTKRKIVAFIVVGLVVLIGGTSYFLLNQEKTPKEEVKKDDPVKEKEPEPTVKVIDVNSKSRPYAVMINNNSAVWNYQSGLNEAYIIYEMLVEGGITREMALFKDSDAPKIQSIRSSRHYFLDYVLENDAIYAHWGWSPKAQSDISSLKINNINGLTYEGTYFFRDKTMNKVAYEHRGYSTMEKLKAAAEKKGYRTTTDQKNILTYSAKPIELNNYEGVGEANYVEVPYSGSYAAKFFYNAETKMYERSQNNTELIDYTSKERVVTKNIIVYNVGYKTIDSYGRQDMTNIGSGEGYYISEGLAVPITWEKSSRSNKTVYKFKNGDPLIVNDGTTYIGLSPNGRTVKFS